MTVIFCESRFIDAREDAKTLALRQAHDTCIEEMERFIRDREDRLVIKACAWMALALLLVLGAAT
jgi:hypothetical protein